jgi:subtilisin family serine protease
MNITRIRTLAFSLLIICIGSTHAATISSLSDIARSDYEGDTIPVIVELTVPNQSMSRAKRSGGWINLGDHLESLQDKAIEEFGWRNLNEIVKYKTQPSLARRVSERELADLLKSSSVRAVYKDEVRGALLNTSAQMIGMSEISDASNLGDSRAVAIIDSGVDSSHPFLSNRVVGEVCFSRAGSCPGGAKALQGRGAGRPCHGKCAHGTHVAGIAAGANSQMMGTAPGANIVAVQVFSVINGDVGAYDSNILQGLEWVYLNSDKFKIAAVNMSLGGGKFTSQCDHFRHYKQIIDLLVDTNIAVVIASGNSAETNAIAMPACISSSISVGSLEKTGEVSNFSDSYQDLSVMAPGGDINSAIPGGEFQSFSGTSMAAAHVAGAFTSMAAAFPQADYKDIYQAMLLSGTFRDPRNGLTLPSLDMNDMHKYLSNRFNSAAPIPKPKPKPTPKPKAEPDEERIDGILIERDSESSDGSIQW